MKENGEPGKRMQKTERENILNGRNTYTSGYTSRSESAIMTMRHWVMRDSERGKKKEEKENLHALNTSKLFDEEELHDKQKKTRRRKALVY